MKVVAASVLIAAAICIAARGGAVEAGNGDGCTTPTSLYSAEQTCHYTHTTLVQAVTDNAGSVQYKVQIVCLSGLADGLCNNPRTCDDPPGSVLYNVYSSTDGNPFTFAGDVCLLSGQDQDFGGGRVTVEIVEKAFQNLSWPISPVSIQPPNGRTLVNLATNFLTTNSQPTSQHVTLIGHDVEIEAAPVRWAWHFGDGADDTTTTPGAAYPDLEITHTYLDADVTVHPSVDTDYHGRYRVDGGDWHDIPVERTVAGTAVDLQILEARPVLVAPSS